MNKFVTVFKMIASEFAFCILACFLFLNDKVCRSSEYQSKSILNYAMFGHSYKHFKVLSLAKCTKFCKSERACISVNFEGNVDSESSCTFNGCGVEDGEKIHESLVFSPGCTYHQLRPTEAAVAEVGIVFAFTILILNDLKS